MNNKELQARIQRVQAGQAAKAQAQVQSRGSLSSKPNYLKDRGEPKDAGERSDRLPQASQILSCGFTRPEADYLHQAIRAAGMQWFEGDGLVMGKKDAIELNFRPGQSEFNRWVVLCYDCFVSSETTCCKYNIVCFETLPFCFYNKEIGVVFDIGHCMIGS